MCRLQYLGRYCEFQTWDSRLGGGYASSGTASLPASLACAPRLLWVPAVRGPGPGPGGTDAREAFCASIQGSVATAAAVTASSSSALSGGSGWTGASESDAALHVGPSPSSSNVFCDVMPCVVRGGLSHTLLVATRLPRDVGRLYTSWHSGARVTSRSDAAVLTAATTLEPDLALNPATHVAALRYERLKTSLGGCVLWRV